MKLTILLSLLLTSLSFAAALPLDPDQPRHKSKHIRTIGDYDEDLGQIEVKDNSGRWQQGLFAERAYDCVETKQTRTTWCIFSFAFCMAEVADYAQKRCYSIHRLDKELQKVWGPEERALIWEEWKWE